MEYLFGDTDAGQDSVFLDEQSGFSHDILGDATKGGMVAVADVFGKSQVYQLVVQFVYCVHICLVVEC